MKEKRERIILNEKSSLFHKNVQLRKKINELTELKDTKEPKEKKIKFLKKKYKLNKF